MKNFLTTLAVIAGIILAVWIMGMLFIGLAVVAVIGYGIYFARGFLTDKGILNPTPGVAQDEYEPEQITIIDGDFTRVEDKENVQ